jgi:hypothetical protein
MSTKPVSPFITGSISSPRATRLLVGRRRTTPRQGRALEILGHAVEYLADSRLYDLNEAPADGEAIRVLMSCSRQVFAECELIQPLHRRLRNSLLRHLQGTASFGSGSSSF